MKESKEVMNCDASSLMLFDEQSQRLFFEVAQGPRVEEIKSIRLELGQGIAGACAKERQTIVVPDVSKDPRHFKGADEKMQYHTRNLVAAVMVRGERLIGVLEVLNKNNNGDFAAGDVKLLEFFAGEAAIAIENALLIKEKVEAERLAAIGVAVAGISHYAKNILAGIIGSAKLVDMGLARLHHVESTQADLTASGVTLGTFDYISPEQARDPRSADVRSDLYSLGCTFYFTLTGQPPFPEGTVLQKLLSHSSEAPPDPRQYRPDLPEEVTRILSKMLSKHPEDRYQEASELIGELLLMSEKLGLPVAERGAAVWITPGQVQISPWEKHLPWAVPVVGWSTT